MQQEQTVGPDVSLLDSHIITIAELIRINMDIIDIWCTWSFFVLSMDLEFCYCDSDRIRFLPCVNL